ncbi:FtsW/RodA/SpoVE family cell cycle protein [Sporosarcina trichiuri]|uniref:FtsW/RodA/SpoVE family cell cycle protein n=1 Tax=Sporosarcina trichiuri TaxID=3056445 RepID=UPI0025B46EB2|nr:FtsW/RodA/SpoVE family cell cycle protein [Sporosarcina sp. 0.2-SM1T-5]WJY26818.1 FtsW/RodA/SpoVE family cell cycle protein [Sporosarcina sp. 0.2-SM1T-5]
MSSEAFVQAVTRFIRSKEARRHVAVELQNHLEESKQAWLRNGYPEEEAEQKTVAAMGSASQLGKSMNKIHRPAWDFWLIGIISLLLAAGFLPLFSADFQQQFDSDLTGYFVQHRLLHVGIGVGIIAALIYIDYRKLQRFSLPFYAGAIVLLVCLWLLPATYVNGQAMLQIGPLRLQTWMALPFLVTSMAGFFTAPKWKGWQLAGFTLVPILLFTLLSNLTVLMLYMAVSAVLFGYSYFSRRVKIGVFSAAGGIGLCIAAFGVYAYHRLLAPYQTERITAFLNPESYSDSAGYMILLLKEALAEAGLFGAEMNTYIPEAHTDYALVQLIHSYGYVAGVLVIMLLLAVTIRVAWMARTLPRSFGKLLILASVTVYSMQSLYSILMIFGFLPLTGMSLPFISYGLLPLLIHAFLLGMVLSVYRRKLYVTNSLSSI